MTTNVLTFPTDRSTSTANPSARPAIHLELHRERSATMLDWQARIVEECQKHETLNPALVTALKRMGLLDRCTFLLNDHAGGPLRFRYIGCPTILVLGRAWARQNLGRPHVENPHGDFPVNLGAEYAEAVHGGEPVHNRVRMHGPAVVPSYTHVLAGWRRDDGREAVLSAIALQHPQAA